MKKYLAIALAAVMTLSVNAQENENKGYNRISLGYTSMNYKSSDRGCQLFLRDKNSFNAGGASLDYARGIALSKKTPLYLEVGIRVFFNTHHETYTPSELSGVSSSYNSSSDGLTEHFTNVSLNIPVNLSYRFRFNNGMYIAPFVGAHVRGNMYAGVKEKKGDSVELLPGWDLANKTYNLLDDCSDMPDYKSSDGKKGFGSNHCHSTQFGGQVGVNFGYKRLNLGIAYIIDSPFYSDKMTSDINGKITNQEILGTIGINF